MKSLILLDHVAEASKINNVFALICFISAVLFSVLAGVIAIKQKPTDTNGQKLIAQNMNRLIIAALCLATIGCIAHIWTYKNIEKELESAKTENIKITNDRDINKINTNVLHSIKDSCVKDKIKLREELTQISEENKSLNNRFEDLKIENRQLKLEITQFKSHEYQYYCGFAAVRDPKSGKWGYLKKGQPKSSIEFIYDDACRFSEGRAFVKYNSSKYGIIDKSFGIPIVPCIFEKPQWFENGRALVTYKGERIYIDKKGDRISSAIKNAIAAR